MESGKYAVSAAGGHGVGARKERGGQHHHRCLGRHGVYESSDGIDLGAPERYSYQMIKESGAFVINLTTEDLCYATDYCGVRSGRDVDKFKEMKLTKVEAEEISAPMIGESPVNIECKVEQVLELGSHHMFLAKVVAVHADEAYMDERGRFDLNRAKPIVYSHGEYFGIGKKQGTFGWSVKKKSKTPNIKTKNRR